LSTHAAAGRLSVDEVEDRIAAALAALYARELAAVEADLPQSVDSRHRRPSDRPSRPAWSVALVALGALCVVASLAAGHPVGFPLLFAFLVWRWLRGRQGSRPSTEGSAS
jgi:hypothetical protein